MPELTLTQSVAATVVGRGYLSSDHLSTATGLDPAIMISKNGGNFANPAAGASVMTEIEATGWYTFALGTDDTDTLGPLIIRGTHATMDNIEVVYQVVADGVTLADNAITADKYDQTTAYPVPQPPNMTAFGNIGIDWANVENPETEVSLSLTSISSLLSPCVFMAGYSNDDFSVNRGVTSSTTPAGVAGNTSFVDATWDGEGDDWCVNYMLIITNSKRVYRVVSFVDSTDTITVDRAMVAGDAESPYLLVPDGPAGGSGAVTIADGAIKATTFDGSTAFPLTATDSGSTYIARTGADSDTLEVLSDQIDAAALEATLTAIKGAGWTTETLAAIDVLIDAIKAKTDNLPSDPADQSAVEAAITAATSGLSTLTAAQVWQYVIETLTAEQIMRVTLAVLTGKASGGGSTPIAFRDKADTKDRVSMTVDGSGNRSAVTIDAT